MDFIRDYAMYAAIFGFFAIVWFGWAQEKPPKQWRLWLGLGSVASVLCMVAGMVLAATNWQAATALGGRGAYITFGVIVFTEVLAAALGSFMFIKRKKPEYVSAWIAFVVGAHFLPLAWVFQDPWLHVLTALACTVPLLAVVLARRKQMAVSALVGAGMGVVLLAFALRGLILFFGR